MVYNRKTLVVLSIGEKNKFLSQYNIMIISVFVMIVFSAFSFFTYRYFSDLAIFKKNEISTFNNQVIRLNDILTADADALLSMQKFANYFLKYPDDLQTKTPELSQAGEHYFIKHRDYDVIAHKDYVRNNITGIGDITRLDDAHKAELAMSNMLTPAFVNTKQIHKEAVWLYYVSKKKFVSIYPSINRNSWQYNDALFAGEHTKKILKTTSDNKSVTWSAPYDGSEGTGLNISLGIGVFNQSEMAGILYMDISLARVQQKLDKITPKNMGLLILDNDNNVLLNHDVNPSPINQIEQWKNIVPESLSSLTNAQINALDFYQEAGDWLVQKQVLPINGWKVIKYQSYQDFRDPLFTHYLVNFIVVFLGLFVFLLFVYFIIHRTFVKPTQRFISHIEYCSQGDPGKIKPTSDWLPWYQVVENIFGQNRSLLQRLKDQNLLLDSRVNEKTKELQEKIIQHERDYALLKSVMNAIPEYIIFNDINGNIVGFNNAFGQFIGRNTDDVLGQKASAILPNELGIELTKLSTSKDIESGLQRIIKTNGNTYDIYCTNIHSDTGIEVGTIDVIRDVTTQYDIQAALEKTKNQAEFANKAKSQFLANMSHEIRTPINAIQGMITLLGRSDLTNNQRQHIDNAYGASKSLLYLVDQLLDLAKIESGEMTIVKERASLDSIINKAIKLNIGMINKKNLNIFVDIASSVPVFVETDEMRLIQVLTNLIQNSVKFTEQGEITIKADLVSQNNNKATIRFIIKDTGIGIAAEKQSHLFEAFKQADESMTRQYGGSGLGLSICQQIVHLLAGEISLKSELNQGCEFTVELPFVVCDEQLKQDNTHQFILYNYGVELSENLLESIKRIGWEYRYVTRLDSIDNANINDKYILLTSSQNLEHIIQSNVQKRIELLCILQSINENISTQESILQQLNVPYTLQEAPLYRYVLQEIRKSVQRLNKVALCDEIKQSKNLQGVNVLLVEDNLVNQLVAKELLVSMKANVIIAANGKIALELLDKHNIDVVLMDIQMPVMDGLTATRLIREQDKYSNLPIIAMTAHARKEDRDNSIMAGMNLHMAKPVKYDTLLNQILSLTKKNN